MHALLTTALGAILVGLWMWQALEVLVEAGPDPGLDAADARLEAGKTDALMECVRRMHSERRCIGELAHERLDALGIERLMSTPPAVPAAPQ